MAAQAVGLSWVCASGHAQVLHARAGGWNTEFPGFPQAVEEHQEHGREAGGPMGLGIRVKQQTQSGELDVLGS